MAKVKCSPRKIAAYCILLIGIPLAVLLFYREQYAIISVVIAFGACVPFFLAYERKMPLAREAVLLAVMVALTVASRVAFAVLPSFKPVTALVIMAALYFGPEAGFLTGALSALLSNIYFGQGPWTPFQMFAWGFVGFIAGLLRRPLQKHLLLLLLYGALAGVTFSMLMDIYTVLSFGQGFQLARYGAALISALPITAIYAGSNVAFLLVLRPTLGRLLTRIKKRYGLET